MHPGWADTPGVVTSLPVFHKVMGPLLRDPATGADTIVWLAATDPAPGGGQLPDEPLAPCRNAQCIPSRSGVCHANDGPSGPRRGSDTIREPRPWLACERGACACTCLARGRLTVERDG